MAKILLDTNILIEILKSNQNVLDFLNNNKNEYCISSISAMELYIGALNKKELGILQKFVNSFEIITINELITNISTNLIIRYAKSHSLHIADAIIAATAIHNNILLYTLNLKDFKYISELRLLN